MKSGNIYVPDGIDIQDAFTRTTHLAIGAHPDDLEVMAYHGIAQCHRSEPNWFGGLVVCDGAGSPQDGKVEGVDMIAARKEEQQHAAKLGEYSFALQMAMPSSSVKGGWNSALVVRLAEILDSTHPQTLYLHSPFDRHATHLAVFAHAIRALKTLPEEARPERILGCEVWRDLDWLDDEDKVRLDVSGHPALARKILDVFGSQIQGGKNYTEAALGRRRAHATFSDSHAVDQVSSLSYAVDLRPLVNGMTVAEFVEEKAGRFKKAASEAVSVWK
ncbi:MAG: PIG-L family deacetylase [Elusimicrobia bacterium]|nr:MAG: PIG-L family deacetylase [Elusimicrobiota bacterium]